MSLVDKQRTPVLLEELAPALEQGHLLAIGCVPTEAAKQLAWAMLCHEHGVENGYLHAVWNFNLGNHDATAEDKLNGVDIFETVPEREVGAGGEYKAVHTRPAYADAIAGAGGYWNRVFVGFSRAYYAMDSGDPTDFAAELKKRGYFTDNVAVYAHGLKLWLLQYPKYLVVS